MRRAWESVKRVFDLNDVFVFGGLALTCYGVWQIYPPASFVTAGVVLFWLGIR